MTAAEWDEVKRLAADFQSAQLNPTVQTYYIFSFLMFVVKHKDLFTINMEFHKINTCQKSDFHIPLVSLLKFKKEYSILVLHYLLFTPHIKQVAHGINKFKHKLRKFLIVNSFHSVCEYLDWNNKFDFGVSQ
jgi:hypothetical protein